MKTENSSEVLAGRVIAILLTVACLVILLAGCYQVFRPFMNAAIWAAMICFSTWPIYYWMVHRLKIQRTLAAFLMTILVMLVIMLPVALLGVSLADDVGKIVERVQNLFRGGMPDPPSWLVRIPWVGRMAEAYWKDLAHDSTKLLGLAEGFVKSSGGWFLARGKDLIAGAIELIITLFILFFFYRDGELIVKKVNRAIKQIAGEHTQHLLLAVEGTAKGVVYGVLGTALAQGTLAALGFWMFGVPMALLLGVVTFFLSLVPMGPPLVWIPASLWLVFGEEAVGRGIFLALWGLLVVSSVDNFLKPYLISRGSDLPFALVFLGVLGGLVAFGPIGVFLGPILLAAGYTLLKAWGADAAEDHVEET